MSAEMSIATAALTAALALTATPLGLAATNDAASPIVASAKPTKLDPRSYVSQRASRSGWNARERRCLYEIIHRESRWMINADNPQSSAYGLFQLLHLKRGTSLAEQTRRGIAYITARYETPCRALAHHNAHGWY